MKEVVIVGAGPAGLTAAIYCARAKLNPVVFEGNQLPGGQLMTTTDVENFPGFPDGIYGPDIVLNMKKQAQKFGASFLQEYVFSIDNAGGNIKVDYGKGVLETKSLIIATGATPRKLDIPGLDEFWQKGISTCATCDGALPIFRNKPIVVVGGGDSAMEEALFLSRFASKVTIVHRRNEFRASRIMVERAIGNSKIDVLYDSVVKEAKGDNTLKSVITENIKNGIIDELFVSGLFFAIGHVPCSGFVRGIVETDANGYVKVIPGSSNTGVPGIFAAGDVCDPNYRQAITAAGSGCMAAIDCERWLFGKE